MGTQLKAMEHHLLYGIAPETRHTWTRPASIQAKQASTRFTYPEKMES